MDGKLGREHQLYIRVSVCVSVCVDGNRGVGYGLFFFEQETALFCR